MPNNDVPRMIMPETVFLSRIFYSSIFSREFHADANNEVLHIINGSMKLVMESGLEYHAGRHDTLFIPYGMRHRDVFERRSDLEIFHINFRWAEADNFFRTATPNCLEHAPRRDKSEVALIFDMFRLDEYNSRTSIPLADARLAHVLAIARRFVNSGAVSLPEKPVRLVSAAKLYMEGHIDEPLDINRVSAHLGVSRSTLVRAFRNSSDLSFGEYLTGIRMQQAAVLLREGHISVADCALRVGYPDSGYFSRAFKKHFGFTPRQIH